MRAFQFIFRHRMRRSEKNKNRWGHDQLPHQQSLSYRRWFFSGFSSRVAMCCFLLFFARLSFGMLVEDLVTEANTWATYGQAALSVIKQGEMVQNEITSLQNEAKNLQTLPGNHWADTQQILNQLAAAMQQSKALTYATENLMQKFQAAYPGYKNQATTHYATTSQTRTQAALSTFLGVMTQLHKSFKQQSQSIALTQQLITQANTPTGRLQALQTANELSGQTILELQKIKATMMAQASAQANYDAYRVQQAASQQHSVNAVVQNTSDTDKFPTYQNKTQFGLIPSFGSP